VDRGTRHGGRWCDRCRNPAGGPAQHRRGSQHIAVTLAQQHQCGTVGFAEHVITCTQPVAEHVLAHAIAKHVALAQPVQVTVAFTVPEQVRLPQPVTLAEQVGVPEPVALAGSRLIIAEQCTLPEPVALALARQVQATVALAVAP